MKEYSNPEVQNNRREYDMYSLERKHYEAALNEIVKLETSLKEDYGRESECLTETKALLEKNRTYALKKLNKLDKECKKLRENCQHDFKFVEESYTGNFDFYACTKCGQVEMRKA